MIVHADCLTAMAAMEPESVDAIVTDPPYGLGFMGKAWDDASRLASVPPSALYPADGTAEARGAYPRTGKGPGAVAFDGRAFQEWSQRWAEAAYRVAKPSAYLLAFGGTRTVHRMTVALEDAGWIIRDMLVWAYASGFPKSKASLKPAWEPIVMARKPGPLRMLRIDECRIPHGDPAGKHQAGLSGRTGAGIMGPAAYRVRDTDAADTAGRWPANVILTDPIFDGGIEGVVGGGDTVTGGHTPFPDAGATREQAGGFAMQPRVAGSLDSGTYSRFFLIPKADRADREPVLGGLLGSTPAIAFGNRVCRNCGKGQFDGRRDGPCCDAPNYAVGQVGRGGSRTNLHPTVKPTELMRHLVRLVTPSGGTVLDPFGGSGTTALACELEGFPWVLIEKEAEYVQIAEARLNGTQRGLGLVG